MLTTQYRNNLMTAKFLAMTATKKHVVSIDGQWTTCPTETPKIE